MNPVDLPIELQRRVDGVAEIARNHLMPDLAVSDYQPVYSYFDGLPSLYGRIARTHLSILVAKRVLPIWYSLPDGYGYRTFPKLIISTAEQFLLHMREGLTAEELSQLAAHLRVLIISGIDSNWQIEMHPNTVIEMAALAVEMDVLTAELPYSPYHHAWCAFLAAAAALNESLGGHDHSYMEAPQWAARADGGGHWSPLEPKNPFDDPKGVWDYSSPETRKKRVDFWMWWCYEAIPTVWRAFDLKSELIH